MRRKREPIHISMQLKGIVMLSAANISCLRNILFGFFAFVFIIVCNLYAGADGVSQERLQRLAKGTNLPGWLWLNRGEPQALETRYSDETLQLIRSLGFTHVRIPIDMANAHEPRMLIRSAMICCLC